MCTDLSHDGIEIIRFYGLRFKIEVSFKQALRALDAYARDFLYIAVPSRYHPACQSKKLYPCRISATD